MKKRKITKYSILLSVIAFIPISVTLFKDSIEIKGKISEADINMYVSKRSLDGYDSYSDKKYGLIFSNGLKYEATMSHNHNENLPIIINQININSKKINDNYKCNKKLDIENIIGAGTIKPLIYRISVLNENESTVKLLTDSNDIKTSSDKNILSINNGMILKLSHLSDDTEIIQAHILLKDSGLYAFSFEVIYIVSESKKSIFTEVAYICY